jgi:hypothetical protein
MSVGKYISLEEKRKTNKLDGFIKEHPSEGNAVLFENLLDQMSRNNPIKKTAKVRG